MRALRAFVPILTVLLAFTIAACSDIAAPEDGYDAVTLQVSNADEGAGPCDVEYGMNESGTIETRTYTCTSWMAAASAAQLQGSKPGWTCLGPAPDQPADENGKWTTRCTTEIY